MIIHIIRHTTPEVELGTCYGQTDLPLAETFEQEAKQVTKKLFDHYDAVYTSPLQRCSRLSEKLESPHHITDQRLMEYDFGDWELVPWSDFKSDAAQTWMNNFVDQPAPNGDSLLTMQSRVADFWAYLLSCEYETVAVVSHSGVLRLIHGAILETPLTHLFRLQLDFGSVLEAKFDKKSELITIKHL